VVPTTEKPGLAGPSRPLGVPDIPQFHLPASGKKGVYAPRLYGAAVIKFGTRRQRISETRRVAFLVPLDPAMKGVDWDTSTATEISPDQLLKDAPVAALYLPLPATAMQLNMFTRWAKHFDRWLARTQRFDVTAKPDAKDATAKPDAKPDTKQDPNDVASLGPKRGGVSIELVAIVWELT
jgi:hypothetical protein